MPKPPRHQKSQCPQAESDQRRSPMRNLQNSYRMKRILLRDKEMKTVVNRQKVMISWTQTMITTMTLTTMVIKMMKMILLRLRRRVSHQARTHRKPQRLLPRKEFLDDAQSLLNPVATAPSMIRSMLQIKCYSVKTGRSPTQYLSLTQKKWSCFTQPISTIMSFQQ